ncbi:MAG: LpqB family beta-propeller domain-containing protein [Corynebacterium sp.]|nr:LpqB family beta-propeller domain-containing protein [Corynebacterium sp.]
MSNYWVPVLRVAAVSMLVTSLSACATIPSSSPVTPYKPYEAVTTTSAPQGPTPGADADIVVREYLAALLDPANQHAEARAFMTSEAAQSWDDTAGVTVVENLEYYSTAPTGPMEGRTLALRGQIRGTLATGGVFTPAEGEYDESIQLAQVDGQWRIAAAPNGVVMQRADLLNRYDAYSVYFFDSTGSMLSPDMRWVYRDDQKRLDVRLIEFLIGGPRGILAPGVMTDIPTTAVLSGSEDGVYSFTGVGTVDTEKATRIAAQVVWTLSAAGMAGPFQINVDDQVIGGEGGVTSDDYESYKPGSSLGAVSSLYALLGGRLNLVTADQVKPVSGVLGTSGRVESAQVASATSVVAAVMTEGENKKALYVGPIDGELTHVSDAQSMTAPSFEYQGTALWLVVDGNKIVRVSRSAQTGEIAVTEISSPEFADLPGSVSSFRISLSGVRVAAVVDRTLYVGTVNRSREGTRTVVNTQKIAPTLAGTVETAEWMSDGNILVGTSSMDSPVYTVTPDGSDVEALDSGNLLGPVRAVEESGNLVFATDSRAMWQMPVSSLNGGFWREVPGLEGLRAIAVAPS